MTNYDIILNLLLGISLSAAVGFRIFVPLLIMSIASLSGHLSLSSGFEWIGTYPALFLFAVASLFELGAYFIPFLDNLLDTIAGPTAVIAGIIVMASSIVEMGPLLKWTLAIIAGGGAAGVIQSLTTITRGASSVATAGVGNSFVSIAETSASVGISLLAISFPLIIGSIVLLILVWSAKKLMTKINKSNQNLS